MRALIWIIILLLIGFGIWWFVRDEVDTDLGDNAANVQEAVQVQGNDDIDLSEFQDKG